MGRSKSYAERLFDFPPIGKLNKADSRRALEEPVQESGEHFAAAALTAIINITEGYPYFLQEWGYQSWNLATKSPISLATVNKATDVAIQRLEHFTIRLTISSAISSIGEVSRTFPRCETNDARAYGGPQAIYGPCGRLA